MYDTVWYGTVLVWYGFGQMALGIDRGGGAYLPLPLPLPDRPGQTNQLTGYRRGSWERSQNPVLLTDPSALARRSFSTFFFSFYFFTFLLFYYILKIWRFEDFGSMIVILGFLIYTNFFFFPILSLLFSPFPLPPPSLYRFLQSALGCCQCGNAFFEHFVGKFSQLMMLLVFSEVLSFSALFPWHAKYHYPLFSALNELLGLFGVFSFFFFFLLLNKTKRAFNPFFLVWNWEHTIFETSLSRASRWIGFQVFCWFFHLSSIHQDVIAITTVLVLYCCEHKYYCIAYAPAFLALIR